MAISNVNHIRVYTYDQEQMQKVKLHALWQESNLQPYDRIQLNCQAINASSCDYIKVMPV